MAILSEATRTGTAGAAATADRNNSTRYRIIGHNTFSFFATGRQHPGQAIRYSLAEVNPVPGTKATQARPATNRHRP
jgi:hypothetical protein